MQGPDSKSFRVVLTTNEDGEPQAKALSLAFWMRETADECGRAVEQLASAPFLEADGGA